MKLSIIIPVYNEKRTIEEVLKRVEQASTLNYEKEIIVVDDCSSDGTSDILEKLKKKFNFVLVRHDKNYGKGKAIKTGLKKVTGNFVLIQDADLEYDPNDYENLLKLADKRVVVFGSRNINPTGKGYPHYVLGVKILTFLFNLLFKSKLTDIYTCYKLFPANLIKSIPFESSGFEFEAEISARILKRGYQIKEVPIRYYPRKFKEGKKIRPSDGLKGLWTIIKFTLRKEI